MHVVGLIGVSSTWKLYRRLQWLAVKLWCWYLAVNTNNYLEMKRWMTCRIKGVDIGNEIRGTIDFARILYLWKWDPDIAATQSVRAPRVWRIRPIAIDYKQLAFNKENAEADPGIIGGGVALYVRAGIFRKTCGAETPYPPPPIDPPLARTVFAVHRFIHPGNKHESDRMHEDITLP